MDTGVSNLFGILRSNYGPSIVKDVNDLLREVCKEARFTNHRVFMTRCRDERLVPKSLRRKPAGMDQRSKDIAARADMANVKNRLHQIIQRLKAIRSGVTASIESLREKLSPSLHEAVVQLARRRQTNEYLRSKSIQIRKFRNLMRAPMVPQAVTTARSTWVRNLSSKVLTPSESAVLEKGLKFNLNDRPVAPEVIVGKLEPKLENLPPELANDVRHQIVNLVKEGPKTVKPNLNQAEKKALEALRSDSSIVCLKADKGNVTVVMDTKDYKTKMYDHLQNGPYQKVTKKSRTLMNKLAAEVTLFTQRVKHKLTTAQAFYLNPKTKICPRIYGLPKIHKAAVPLRPIVDFTGSPTYAWARHLARILRPLSGKTNTFVPNSTRFSEEIRHLCLQHNEVMLSYDVVSLYTKVPIDDALSYINSQLSSDTTLHERTNLSADEIMQGCKHCLLSTTFVFEGGVYQQIEGLPMGSPLSPIVANLFMESFEQQALQSFPYPPRIWRRYVDDTFVVIDKDHKDAFLEHLNSRHLAIQFTMEAESETGQIPFLDCLVMRADNNSLATTVFRKPTSSEQYIQHDSGHLWSTKVAFIHGLLTRAERLCSTPELKDSEFKLIMNHLMLNGYTERFIKGLINRHHVRRQADSRNWGSAVALPYIEGKSEAIRRVLGQVGIKATFTSNNNIGRTLTHLKDSVPDGDLGNVVYRINCLDCETVYVGETSRPVTKRAAEHRTLSKRHPTNMTERDQLEKNSAIALHALENSHKVDFNNPVILSKDWKNSKERKAAEKYLISREPHACNKQRGSLHSAWSCLKKRRADALPIFPILPSTSSS